MTPPAPRPESERPQTAIVTGSAVRIGRSVVLELARRGWQVLVHYRESGIEAGELVEEVSGEGGVAIAVQADLCEPWAAAETLFEAAESRLGRVSLLVNNAAIFEGGGLGATDQATWQMLFAINLEAPYVLSQRFVEGLGESGTGQIINLVDWRGLQLDPQRLAYSLTKQGLVSLTRSLAESLAPRVRVNAVAPGPVLPAVGADEDELAAAVAASPLATGGTPEDVVDAIGYLLDARLVTGDVLSVAGGAQLAASRTIQK
jgi:NAD(P)-dependent dehydrogenase (short-subunit alcohol dehydrogenase family)